MAYDVSDIELYSWAQDSTFGATTVTHWIVGPKGKVGFVRDILVEVTTSLSATTTVPEVQIGISSGDFTYGRYRLGTDISHGYIVGPHRASQELISGNPPRTLADFTGHVVLDGGPLTSSGIAGGSYGTVVPKGRIPASGWPITSVIQGVDSSHSRIFLNGAQPAKDLVVGQSVIVQGVLGSTSVNGLQVVTALDTVSQQYFEVAQTFSSAYTGGGNAYIAVMVTCLAGTGGTPGGGGYVKVKIQWLGAESD